MCLKGMYNMYICRCRQRCDRERSHNTWKQVAASSYIASRDDKLDSHIHDKESQVGMKNKKK